MSRTTNQLPVSDTTANAVTVNSTTGFSAGELIYYKNGDYAPISNTALTSAPFDLTVNQPLTANSALGNYYVTGNMATQNYGGKCQTVAKLSNGNLVRVFFEYNTGIPQFEIYNQSNVEVVAPTTINSTYINNTYTNISVSAFASGGFVVAWVNSGGGTNWSVNYAVYNNSGTSTLAAVQDTSTGGVDVSTYIEVSTTSNDYFFIVVGVSSTVRVRCWTKTGTAQFAWYNTSIASSAGWPLRICTRSNNNLVMAIGRSGPNDVAIRVLDTSGTVVNSQNYMPSGASQVQSPSVACDVMSDGSTVVIVFASLISSVWTYQYVTLNNSNTLSAEYTLPTSNINPTWSTAGTPNLTSMNVKCFSNGTWAWFMSDTTYAINYAIFNNAGTCLTGVNSANGKAAPILVPGSMYQPIVPGTAVETTSGFNFYFHCVSYNSSFQPMVFFKVSNTSYQLVPGSSIPATVGTATTNVNAYSKLASGPSYAKFVASTSSTLSQNLSTQFTSSASTIVGSACNALHGSSWSNGSYAIAYRTTGSLINYVNIYNASNALVTTINVGITTAGSPIVENNTIRVACLSNGGFAVAWIKASTSNMAISIYDSSYVLVNEVASPSMYNPVSTIDYNFDLAALTGGGFVFAYIYSSAYYAVYSSGGTLIINNPAPTGGSPTNIAVAPSPWNGFALTYSDQGSSVNRFYMYYTINGTSWQYPSGWTFGSSTGGYGNKIMRGTGCGLFIFPGFTGGSTTNYIYILNAVAGYQGSSQYSYNCGDYRRVTVGAAGNGMMCFMEANNGGTSTLYTTGSYNYGTAPALALFNMTGVSGRSGSSGSCVSSFSGPGANTIMLYLNANNLPSRAVISLGPYTATANTVAGTTTSASLPVNPSTNGTLNGYIFQGVSVTAAPAGGTGIVQTNGTATLNSNYSASAPSSTFDYTMPNGSGITGVKGNAVGRTVTLKGTM